jgi:hypothetical protein
LLPGGGGVSDAAQACAPGIASAKTGGLPQPSGERFVAAEPMRLSREQDKNGLRDIIGIAASSNARGRRMDHSPMPRDQTRKRLLIAGCGELMQ